MMPGDGDGEGEGDRGMRGEYGDPGSEPLEKRKERETGQREKEIDAGDGGI